MFWIVNSSLLCPYTKTAFTSIQTMKNLRLIIWYDPTILLKPGDIISPYSQGLMVNDVYHPFTIFKIHPFSRAWWGTLKNGLKCPGNQDNNPTNCAKNRLCCFPSCPYKLQRQ